MMMTYYKLLTYDNRSPLQHGDPIFDGDLPFCLPPVTLDTSAAECAAGWNWVTDLAAGFRIAGMWKDGRPRRVLVGDPGADVIRRGEKHRSSGGTLLREATEQEVKAGLLAFSQCFGNHAERMAEEQWLWRVALGRPIHDPGAVEAGLKAALTARGLPWELHRYKSARDARAAWDAKDAWDARAAWDAWAVWAAKDARDAWDAWDAWAALTVCYAALMGWIDYAPDRLTSGIRDAYRDGLDIAMPTGANTLGWAMDSQEEGAP